MIINTTSLGFDSEITSIISNFKYFSPISFSEIKFDKLTTKEKVINATIENILDTFTFLKTNSNAIIFDIIYQPSRTLIMKIGEKIGLRTINGLEMNFMQQSNSYVK